MNNATNVAAVAGTPKAKKIVKAENVPLVRRVWAEVDENAETYVSEYGIDLKVFKRFVPSVHGKVFATFRKRKMNDAAMTRALIDKMLGRSATGIDMDVLLNELDESEDDAGEDAVEE